MHEFFQDSDIFPAAILIKFNWEDFHRVGFVPGPPPNILLFTFKSVALIDAMQVFRASLLIYWALFKTEVKQRNHLGFYQCCSCVCKRKFVSVGCWMGNAWFQ